MPSGSRARRSFPASASRRSNSSRLTLCRYALTPGAATSFRCGPVFFLGFCCRRQRSHYEERSECGIPNAKAKGIPRPDSLGLGMTALLPRKLSERKKPQGARRKARREPWATKTENTGEKRPQDAMALKKRTDPPFGKGGAPEKKRERFFDSVAARPKTGRGKDAATSLRMTAAGSSRPPVALPNPLSPRRERRTMRKQPTN